MIPLNPDWRSKIQYLDTLLGTLVEWAASRPEADFMTLWDETIDPEWLPYLAQAGGATKQEMALAACAVARLCLHLIPEGENRPRIAIETAEAWAKGYASEQIHEVTLAAYAAGRNTFTVASASAFAATAYAVYAATNAAAAANTVNHFVNSAAFAANSVAYALQAGIGSQIICATLRKHLPFERPPRPKGLTIWQRLAEGDDE